MSDARTLVKNRQYIDLPGESPKGKMWPGTNNIIQLRQHRDVVFDIKLGNGETYTVEADKGRFYDPKRGLNVTLTTFKDGEPRHLWVGRFFEGDLILKQGDREISRYPIGKMDCTDGCRDADPAAKPAPMLIVMHDDKAFVRDLLKLQEASSARIGTASSTLDAALNRARDGQSGLQNSPFSSNPQSATSNTADSRGRLVASEVQREVSHMVHMFEVKPTDSIDVPKAILAFFKNGDETYKIRIDPVDLISRNWIIGQLGNVSAFSHDAWFGNEPWARQFWGRAFYLVRSAGKYMLMFSTGPEDWKVLGVLLVGYRRAVPNGTKLITIAGGAGSLGGAAKVAWSNAAGGFKGGGLVAVAITCTVDGMVWLSDYHSGKKDWRDLFAILAVDAVKTWLVGATISLATAFAVTAFGATTTAGAGIAFIAVGTVLAIVSVGYIVDAIFETKLEAKKNLSFVLHHPGPIAAKITGMLRSAGDVLERAMPQDYGDSYAASEWALVPEWAMPSGGVGQ